MKRLLISSIMFIVSSFYLFTHSAALKANSDENFVCFSLKAAQRMYEAKNAPISDELKRLGYISEPIGVAIDSLTQDCILIGKQNPNLPPLFLDDFVVALRAVHIFGDTESPGVSIEPPEKKSHTKNHSVKYFAGVEGTRFGKICYEADYFLKRIAYGIASTGSFNIITPWEKEKQWAKLQWAKPERHRYSYSSRTWFYPGAVRIATSANAMRLFKCKVSIATEFTTKDINPRLLPTLLQEIKHDKEQFAIDFTSSYDQLARSHSILEELRSLIKLYTIADIMAGLKVKPDINYWLKTYTVDSLETPQEADLISKSDIGFAYAVATQGGIHMRALARRINAGDPSALAEVALLSRPSRESLTWNITINLGAVQLLDDPEEVEMNRLLIQADYFVATGLYAKAIKNYTEILKQKPLSPELHVLVAKAFAKLKQYGNAIKYCEQAVKIDPASATSWAALGQAYLDNNKSEKALEAFNKALGLSPDLERTRLDRAAILLQETRYAEARADFVRVYKNNRNSVEALHGLGKIFEGKGEIDSAKIVFDYIENIEKKRSIQQESERQIESTENSNLLDTDFATQKKFSPDFALFGDNLWETTAWLDVRQDAGQVFYPRTAALYGPQGQFFISLYATSAIILKNKLRFDLNIPFQLRVASDLDAATGINNVSLGGYYLVSSGIGNHPSIILSAQYLPGFISELFILNNNNFRVPERFYTGFGSSFLSFGAKGEMSLSEKAKLRTSASFMKELKYGASNRPGFEINLRFPFHNSKWLEGIGLGLQYVKVLNSTNPMSKNRSDLRIMLELLERDFPMALGVGFSNDDYQKSSARYFIFILSTNKKLFSRRKWF